MPLHHPHYFRGSRRPSARRFFDEVCPHVLARRSLELDDEHVVAFEVHGDEGGSWTLDLRNAVVLPGCSEDASAQVRISSSDFSELLAGALDIANAVRLGTIELCGDLAAIRALSLVFDVRRLP